MDTSEKYSDRKKLVKVFLIRSGIAYVIWLIAFYGYLQPDGRLNRFLTDLVIKGTVIGLDLFGYETHGEGALVSKVLQKTVWASHYPPIYEKQESI